MPDINDAPMRRRKQLLDDEDDACPDAPFNTCAHAESVGSMAVYVTPDCPHGHTIRGKLACLKADCRTCDSWKQKQERLK